MVYGYIAIRPRLRFRARVVVSKKSPCCGQQLEEYLLTSTFPGATGSMNHGRVVLIREALLPEVVAATTFAFPFEIQSS